MTMKKVRLDNGLDYDASEEVAVEFEKKRKDADEAKQKLSEATKKVDTVTAERDEWKARAEKAEKVDHSQAIKDGIASRLDVLEKARKVLDDETQKKVDSMTDDQIRTAVIKSKYPDLEVEKLSPDYLRSRFDTIVEATEEKGDDDVARKNAHKVMGNPDDSQKRSDSAQKRDEAIAAIGKRSRGEDK